MVRKKREWKASILMSVTGGDIGVVSAVGDHESPD